jgi:hypothetical protein
MDNLSSKSRKNVEFSMHPKAQNSTNLLHNLIKYGTPTIFQSQA